MPDLPYLFVYGSLRAGAGTPWSIRLAAVSRPVGPGCTGGALFHIAGYPGMTRYAEADAWVTGDVCLLNDPASALPYLDAYEGCGPDDPLPHEFERQVVTVVLDGGQTVEAWAYIYMLDTAGHPRARRRGLRDHPIGFFEAGLAGRRINQPA